jgi:F-type H+-transporting ATPase subunit delta
MLLEKNRVAYLPLVEMLSELVDDKEGRMKGTLHTAYPLRRRVKARIEEALGERLQKKVELSVTEDRNLIGGVRVVVGA